MNPQLYIAIDGDDCYTHVEAEISDLVAALREAGVGEVAECLECSSEGVTSCQPFPCEHGGHTCAACQGRGRYLVVRIGGEET